MMDCTGMDRWLDDLMDDKLDEQRLAELEAHVAECPDCAEKLRATRQMKALFSEMAPEIDVPLEAQAGWRSAIRTEAGRQHARRLYRYAGGIAAVLVVALGGVFALRSAPRAANTLAGDAEIAAMGMEAPMPENLAMSEAVMVEADGVADQVDEDIAIAYAGSAAREIRMTVSDLDAACGYLSDLVREYEGSLDEQRFDADGVACANLYIELPGGADAFLAAASHYDTSVEMDADLSLDDDAPASLLMVLRSE